MKDAIETAIKTLGTKAKTAAQPHEAMNFAQAALNLAHTYATMEAIRRENEYGLDTQPRTRLKSKHPQTSPRTCG